MGEPTQEPGSLGQRRARVREHIGLGGPVWFETSTAKVGGVCRPGRCIPCQRSRRRTTNCLRQGLSLVKWLSRSVQVQQQAPVCHRVSPRSYGEGPSHAPGSALGYDRPFRNAGTSTSFGLPGVFFGHNLMRGGQGDDRLSAFNGGGILYGNEGADTIDAPRPLPQRNHTVGDNNSADGADSLGGSFRRDFILGNGGRDTIIGQAGREHHRRRV